MAELQAWHDLFAMVGDVSSVLLGLLFVSASLHASKLAAPENWHIRALAVHAQMAFLVVLLLAIMVLIPLQVPLRFGLQLCGLGVVVLVWTVLLIRHVRRATSVNGPGPERVDLDLRGLDPDRSWVHRSRNARSHGSRYDWLVAGAGDGAAADGGADLLGPAAAYPGAGVRPGTGSRGHPVPLPSTLCRA